MYQRNGFFSLSYTYTEIRYTHIHVSQNQEYPNTFYGQYSLATQGYPNTTTAVQHFMFGQMMQIQRGLCPVVAGWHYQSPQVLNRNYTRPVFYQQPELHQGNIPPDPKADFKIYDRVVCSARNITPPFGARGTITAVYQPSDSNTVRLSDKLNAEPSYQVMFDEPFLGGMKEDLFDDTRFYRMLPTNMINISYGRKLRTAMPVYVEDNRHSAFASYSPPVNRQYNSNSYARDARNVPVAFETRNVAAPKPALSQAPTPAAVLAQNQAPGPDSATNLLRSLLKISENETDSAKRNNKNLNGQQNWRVKNEPSNAAPPQPQRGQHHQQQPHPAAHPSQPQPQNWRAENASANFNKNNRAPAEWTNTTYKTQPPIPPFPNFGPQPQAGQVPFPQFQNPHFQQRQHQDPRFAHQVRGQFPKHLPNVGSNVTLGPSWNKDHNNQFLPTEHDKRPPPSNQQAANQASNSGYKINNPFVPLQVQTRRVHNPSGPSTRRNPEGLPAPKSMVPESQPTPQQVQKGPETTQKPQKKKKLRLAANLPFQLD